MKKLVLLLAPLLVLALLIATAGCGGDDEEEATPTPVATEAGETPTPADGTPKPVYTGGKETFKVSHGSVLGTFSAILWELMDERLQFYTDGKCKMEIYPAASLYRGLEEWDAIATGGVDMIRISDWMPQMQGMMDWIIGYYPYFWGTDHFNQWEHDKRFWEHPDGGGVMLAQLEERGIKGIGMIYSSGLTMNITARAEMKSQFDMEGWKSMSVGGMSDLICHTIPTKPVFLDPAETQIALEQGLIDVMFSDPSRVLATKMYDTVKYGFVSGVTAPHTVLAMHLDRWNSLTPELQDIFINYIIPEGNAYFQEIVSPDYLDGIEELQEEHGMIINWMTLEERDLFRDLAFAKAAEQGYQDLMDIKLLELADRLREQPYDEGHFFP